MRGMHKEHWALMTSTAATSDTCDECYVSIRSYLDKDYLRLLWENVSGYLSIGGGGRRQLAPE